MMLCSYKRNGLSKKRTDYQQTIEVKSIALLMANFYEYMYLFVFLPPSRQFSVMSVLFPGLKHILNEVHVWLCLW